MNEWLLYLATEELETRLDIGRSVETGVRENALPTLSQKRAGSDFEDIVATKAHRSERY